MRGAIHFDISDDANWRSACGTMPSEGGTNLTLADYQVTCRKCLALMGCEVRSNVVPYTRFSITERPDGSARVAA